MESRDKILQAAARVYAECGFRGATTRRIASAAGVNEVTLFRIFGSKTALLDEVLQARANNTPVAVLPETPADPVRELARWCEAYLEHLRGARSLIRKMMSELEERPEIAPCAGNGPMCAARELHGYLERLQRAGLVPADLDAESAVAMLLGTLFADAMGRDVWPNVFPQPDVAAPRRYARLFARAVGIAETRRPAAGRRVAGSKAAKRNKEGTEMQATPPAPPAPRRRVSGRR